MTASNIKNKQRSYFVRAFFILVFIAVVGVWKIFSTYSESSAIKKEKYLVRFNLNRLKPGEVRIIRQHGLPIIIMRRTKQDLKNLLAVRSSLSDPDSVKSTQPDFARNYYRSLKPEYFIAYALNPLYAVEVNYRLKSFKSVLNMDKTWEGGFSDTREGLYDKAGRAYNNHSQNLDIPDYKITPDNILYVYSLKELGFN